MKYFIALLTITGLLSCKSKTGSHLQSDLETWAADVAITDAGQNFPGSKLYFSKSDLQPRPGIIMLHGSEGGGADSLKFWEGDAYALVNSGFTVMFLCYYKCPGRPDKLLRIPLDNVLEAVKTLKNDPHVKGKKIGIFGRSRGAEQAVLVASLLASSEVAAVAAHAPSDSIVGAFDPLKSEEWDAGIYETIDGKPKAAPAWTWQGKDVYGEESLEKPGPRIEIEKYPGPLFLSHGESDEIWPASRSKTLEKARMKIPGLITEAHYWPGEGHVLYRSFTKMFSNMVAFLRQNLEATSGKPYTSK